MPSDVVVKNVVVTCHYNILDDDQILPLLQTCPPSHPSRNTAMPRKYARTPCPCFPSFILSARFPVPCSSRPSSCLPSFLPRPTSPFAGACDPHTTLCCSHPSFSPLPIQRQKSHHPNKEARIRISCNKNARPHRNPWQMKPKPHSREQLHNVDLRHQLRKKHCTNAVAKQYKQSKRA